MLLSALILLSHAGTNFQPIQSPERLLWQIGKPDHSTAKFALGPDQYRNYTIDPLFVVGASKTKDWPYILPGPSDDWAGGKPHRDTIVFGLSKFDPAFTCRMTLDFNETHSFIPPRLKLLVNGSLASSWQAPAGASDAALTGDLSHAKYAIWEATFSEALLKNGSNTIQVVNDSGSWVIYDSVSFTARGPIRLAPVRDQIMASVLPERQVVYRTKAGPVQPVEFEVANLGTARTVHASVGNFPTQTWHLLPGMQTVRILIPRVLKTTLLKVEVTDAAKRTVRQVRIEPIRNWVIYLFPHSHLDIGYTDPQSYVLALHQRNLFDAMKVARESASFPAGDRYKYNDEGTWVVDRLLQRATPAQRAELAHGFRSGTLACSDNYCNLLTAMMRPEELMRSYRFAGLVDRQLGIHRQTASQTDVPGVTWGDVEALSTAGIKNLVLMPNGSDREGGVNKWRDKPFWWVSESGKHRVFVWETITYGIGHGIRGFDGDRSKIFRTADPTKHFIRRFIFSDLDRKAAENYPYDGIGVPWSMSDNPPIDGDVPYAAKAWNAKYVVPRVQVSTLGEACRQMVKRYGGKFPVVRGDFSPYWEDGSGSSARETAMNHASADRLVQDETLYAMQKPRSFPSKRFLEAWRNVVLYSEHTWGSYDSISNPDGALEREIWGVKRGYALTADALSREFEQAATKASSPVLNSVRIFNTNSWTRTGVVDIPAPMSTAGDGAADSRDRLLPSQRLSSGALAVLVSVPAFSSKVVVIKSGHAANAGLQPISATPTSISGPDYTLKLDPATGAISHLWSKKFNREIADGTSKFRLNQFLYLLGANLDDLQTNAAPTFKVVDSGPLVAVIRATSDAPGAKSLSQQYSMTAGVDGVGIADTIDKLPVLQKEGVHIAFPFDVPGGQVRIDTSWAVIRPELDQIAGANKNWLNAQRFVDVSNADFGVTWTSPDVTLIEVGKISANLQGGGYSLSDWRRHIRPTQTLFSWALNNVWYTNSRASQQGVLRFRYGIRAHGPNDLAADARFGTAFAEPLLVARNESGDESGSGPLLQLSSKEVVATSLKPSDDGKALIVRLYGAGGKKERVRLKWAKGLVSGSEFTDIDERVGKPCGHEIDVPAFGVVTIRAELAH